MWYTFTLRHFVLYGPLPHPRWNQVSGEDSVFGKCHYPADPTPRRVHHSIRNYSDMRRLLFLFTFLFNHAFATCPDRVFLGCILRLKAQRVPYGRSIINVVLGIDTITKLEHTCQVYTSTMPCFREKILECGDDKQRRLLNGVNKMINFLCTPASVAAQRALIAHQACISSVLSMSAANRCRLADNEQGKLVLQCREQCRMLPSDFVCLMRAWISEQNVCTLEDIRETCGPEAVSFYREMQSSAFDPSYPVVCEYQKELELGSTTLNTIFEEPIVAVAESNRVQIRGRPKSLAFNVTSPPITAPSLNFKQQSNGPKIVHNNENWNFKKENFAIAHSPTESTQATGGYKVVNLLRNLIPKSLPTELSSFFKRVLEKKTFNHEDHYNTPGISSIIQNVRSNDSSHAIGTMSNNWTPWYFTREDE